MIGIIKTLATGTIVSLEFSKKELKAFEKIKPCPLCGRKKIKIYRNSFDSERHTRFACKCGIRYFGDECIKKAIAAWNKRVGNE